MSVATTPRLYEHCDLDEKLHRLKVMYAVTQTMSLEDYEKHVAKALQVEENKWRNK